MEQLGHEWEIALVPICLNLKCEKVILLQLQFNWMTKGDDGQQQTSSILAVMDNLGVGIDRDIVSKNKAHKKSAMRLPLLMKKQSTKFFSPAI